MDKDTTPATAGATAGGFTAMDRNNDGRVSQSEFEALGGPASGAAGGTQGGSSTSGIGDKPGQKQ